MAYIEFKGHSSEEFHLKILELEHAPRGAEGYEEIIVPGRQNPIIQTTDTHPPTSLLMTAEIPAGADIRAVFQWLSGSGDLITSDEPDKRYIAYACEAVNVTRVNGIYRSICHSFRLAPYAYAVNNAPIVLSSTPSYFRTIGTYWSEPLIELTGNGDVTVDVNGAALTVPAVSGTIYIDATAKKVYRVVNGYKTIITSSGWIEDMILVPDDEKYNVISWEGDVSAVKLTKNERWL